MRESKSSNYCLVNAETCPKRVLGEIARYGIADSYDRLLAWGTWERQYQSVAAEPRYRGRECTSRRSVSARDSGQPSITSR